MNPPDNPPVLLAASGPVSPADIQWLLSKFSGRAVFFLALDTREDQRDLPPDWHRLRFLDLGTTEELRRDYLDYLEAIPERPIGNMGTLDSLCRRRDGYSFWWTDVGVRRSPTQGVFLKIKAVWMLDRAIASCRPADVVIHAADSRDAGILFAAARPVAGIHFAPDSALPAPRPLVESKRWYAESLAYLGEFVRHRRERRRAMDASYPPTPPPAGPVVAMSTVYPRQVRSQGDVPTAWYWEDLAGQLPGIAVRFLMDLENPDAWPLRFDFEYLTKDAGRLAANPALVPRWRGHSSALTWWKARRHQRRLLRRYFRLEQHPQFRSIFRFRGVDLSPEWIAELRHSAAMAIWWESEVDAAEHILRGMGDVRVVLVNQEFELPGMILMAACRRLGITTVGVQHGTFYPLHTIYTPPGAQIRGAPTPDYFAAYGEYHKEVVSRLGHYPADRVWICAGSRFDTRAKHPADRLACRQRLGIPPERFVILMTTQRFAWFPDAVRAVLGSARPGDLVCIKKFDGETVDYDSVAREHPAADSRVFVDRFPDLLGACDVLVSGSSTTVLEATLAGTPTVCVNFSTEPDYYPYVEEGVSLGAHRPDDVGPLLESLRSGRLKGAWQEKRAQFLERHLGPATHGRAAELLADRLRRMVGGPL